jgi:hypothetical protein
MPACYLVRLFCPAYMSPSDPEKTTRGWHAEEITVLTNKEYRKLVRQHGGGCRAIR